MWASATTALFVVPSLFGKAEASHAIERRQNTPCVIGAHEMAAERPWVPPMVCSWNFLQDDRVADVPVGEGVCPPVEDGP